MHNMWESKCGHEWALASRPGTKVDGFGWTLCCYGGESQHTPKRRLVESDWLTPFLFWPQLEVGALTAPLLKTSCCFAVKFGLCPTWSSRTFIIVFFQTRSAWRYKPFRSPEKSEVPKVPRPQTEIGAPSRAEWNKNDWALVVCVVVHENLTAVYWLVGFGSA